MLKGKNVMGKSMQQLVATRTTLQSALKLMSIEQLRELHDSQSGTLADLTELWSSRGVLSSFEEEYLKELKRIVFRLTYRLRRMEAGESGSIDPEQLQFFCIECNMPVPYLGLNNLTCPTCGSTEFLEGI